MNPSVYRRGGTRHGHPVFDRSTSPVGRLLVAATAKGVCAVAMGSSDATLRRALTEEYPAAALTADTRGLSRWTKEILERMNGKSPEADLPLDIRATAFQWQVWKALAAIPRGETRSYSEVAAALPRPRAVRAVARACAADPVALAIPCHRVVLRCRWHGAAIAGERRARRRSWRENVKCRDVTKYGQSPWVDAFPKPPGPVRASGERAWRCRSWRP